MPTFTGTGVADTLTGGSDNDLIEGLGGNDVLIGGGGVDTIRGGDGEDRVIFQVSGLTPTIVDGGAGNDSLDLSAYNASAYFVSQPATIRLGADTTSMAVDIFFFQRGGAGETRTVMEVTGVESLALGIGTTVNLGGYTGRLTVDSRASMGERIVTGSGDDTIFISRPAVATAGMSHSIDAGGGTDFLALSGLATDYLFQQTANGWSIYDGRSGVTTVSNVEYVRTASSNFFTSWQDVASMDFDSAAYLTRYADVNSAVGGDLVKGFQHWQTYGMAEGRIGGAFNALQYIASYRDLIDAFGTNAVAGAQHYEQFGRAEGRSITFNPADYAASNMDLARIIGLDGLATSHYLRYGVYENRPTSGFDSVAYLLSNADLAGLTPAQARTHWLTTGADEGRVGDALFGREQTAFGFNGDSVSNQFETATDKDWFSIVLPVYQNIIFNGSAGVTGLAVYNSTGRLIASDADGRDFRFFITNADGATGPAQYYVVATGGSIGSYSITMATRPLSTSGSEEPDDSLMPASIGLDQGSFTDPYADLAPFAIFNEPPVQAWAHPDGYEVHWLI